MKRIYERPEADVVELHAREALAVIPGTDEKSGSMADDYQTDLGNGGLSVGGGVGSNEGGLRP